MSTIENALAKAEKLLKYDSETSAKDDVSVSEENAERSNDASKALAKSEVETFNWAFLKENGYITEDDSHSVLAEEYRSIKRPLVVNAIGARKKDIQRSNLILVTSSIPGEGKTFTSINLALSIAAELDKKVLLIDADVSKPSVSKVLGIKQTPGLIEYLEGEIDQLSDIILRTEVKGLRVIPAGKRHKFSTELLSSNRMVLLAQELSDRYPDRIVIFDSPPLLATTQAEVLASLVGQVVLVVAAETTSQNIVLESVKKLTDSADVVLTLLNKVQHSLDTSYYGYGQY